MGTPEYIPPIIRDLSWLIPLFPLIGAAIAGFFGAKWLKGSSHVPIWCGVGLSAVISFCVLSYYLGERENHASSSHHLAATEKDSEAIQHSLSDMLVLFQWIEAGDPSLKGKSGAPQLVHDKPNSNAYFSAEATFFFDPLTAVMLCVVCGIGFLITVFAAGYMKGEEGYFRFFAYLGLFIFMMTCLVMGGNLIMLYLGWEGVGLCSYLLIGYYYDKPAAGEAAKESVPGQPNRGLWVRHRNHALLPWPSGRSRLFRRRRRNATPGCWNWPAGQISHGFPEHGPRLDPLLPDARRLWQVGAVPALRLAPRRNGRPDTRRCALIHAATMVTAGLLFT